MLITRPSIGLSIAAAVAILVLAGTIGVARWSQSQASGDTIQSSRHPEVVFPTTLSPGWTGTGESVTLDETSSSQQEALADGVVTFDEYEEATWAAFSCMLDAGLEAREAPHIDASGTRWEYSVWLGGLSSGPDGSDAASDQQTMNECENEHLRFVALAYSLQEKPSDAAIADARSAFLACLIDAGFPETDNLDELVENRGHDIEAFAACSEQVSQEFGIPNFAG